MILMTFLNRSQTMVSFMMNLPSSHRINCHRSHIIGTSGTTDMDSFRRYIPMSFSVCTTCLASARQVGGSRSPGCSQSLYCRSNRRVLTNGTTISRICGEHCRTVSRRHSAGSGTPGWQSRCQPTTPRAFLNAIFVMLDKHSCPLVVLHTTPLHARSR